jgi:hypothetical protein
MDRLTTVTVTTPLQVLLLRVHVVPTVGQAVQGMVPAWRTHRRMVLELLWRGCLLHPCCCHCLRHGWYELSSINDWVPAQVLSITNYSKGFVE